MNDEVARLQQLIPEYRGRPLTRDELVVVGSIPELSVAQRRVIEELSRRARVS